eukprot:1820557-Pyramimonas_sp.AAC.3
MPYHTSSSESLASARNDNGGVGRAERLRKVSATVVGRETAGRVRVGESAAQAGGNDNKAGLG